MVIITGVTTSFAQVKPKIVFEKLLHDYGSFKEEAGIQTTDFVFTNKGSVPLILNNVRASCGCTTPKWTREPVAPGKTGSIQVSYDPKNRPGAFSKSITVQSNAENPTVGLRITGKVEKRKKTLVELYPRKLGVLRVKTNSVSFTKIKQDEVKSQTLELVNDTDQPVKVEFKSVPSHVKAVITPEMVPSKGKSILKVTYDAKAKNSFGFVSDRLYLIINGDNNYNTSVSIGATIVEDFSLLSAEELANAPVVGFDSNSFDFGNMKQGDKVEHTFTIKNEGKSDLIIRNIRSSCGCTAVTPAKKVISAGETAPLKVVFDSRGKRGRQSKSITVITNDPKKPTSTIRVSSNVETVEKK
jgi:hypothetical protein